MVPNRILLFCEHRIENRYPFELKLGPRYCLKGKTMFKIPKRNMLS